jgi:hypothetical protein
VEDHVFAKVVSIVMALGLTACAVLVQRQQRYELAKGISQTHWRILQQERDLLSLREQIARATSPTVLRTRVARLERDWRAIPYRNDDPGVQRVARPTAGAPDAPRVELGG